MIDSSPETQGKKEGDDGQARLVAVNHACGDYTFNKVSECQYVLISEFIGSSKDAVLPS